jgi:predicted transposase YdaD
MGNYDRIIKESIEKVLLTLASSLLNLEISTTEPITAKLQTTVEREPDFLKKVTLTNGQQIILQLEFQLQDEEDMVYRMAEYRAIIQRIYMMPVKQYVIYLGNSKPTMPTKLPKGQRISSFTLKNLKDLPVNDMLASDVPEELVLAILTDFPERDAKQVVSVILRKLKRVAANRAELKKAYQQLLTLSRIRKLEVETKKQIEAMPITYDIKTDGLFLEGKAEGKAEGKVEGKAEERKIAIQNMLLKTDFLPEQIADILEVPLQFVLEVKKSLKL